MIHDPVNEVTTITIQTCQFIHFQLPVHVDLGVPNRPIRFKLSVRTGNPLLRVSQNLPANEATGHPPTVECKQTKIGTH